MVFCRPLRWNLKQSRSKFNYFVCAHAWFFFLVCAFWSVVVWNLKQVLQALDNPSLRLPLRNAFYQVVVEVW